MSRTLVGLGGLAILLAMLALAFGAFNMVANPASPNRMEVPAISFSSASNASVAETTSQLELQADQALATTVTNITSIQVAQATLKQKKMIHESDIKRPIVWVVSNGLMQCLVHIEIFDPTSMQSFGFDNQKKPKTSPCDLDFINEVIEAIKQKGVEFGLGEALMTGIGNFILESIKKEFGW